MILIHRGFSFFLSDIWLAVVNAANGNHIPMVVWLGKVFFETSIWTGRDFDAAREEDLTIRGVGCTAPGICRIILLSLQQVPCGGRCYFKSGPLVPPAIPLGGRFEYLSGKRPRFFR